MNDTDMFADEPKSPGFARVVIDKRNGRLWINDTHIDVLIGDDVAVEGLGYAEIPVLTFSVFLKSIEWIQDYQPPTVDVKLPTLAALR